MTKPPLPPDLTDNLHQLLAYARGALERARTAAHGDEAIRACEEHLRKVEYLIAQWTTR